MNPTIFRTTRIAAGVFAALLAAVVSMAPAEAAKSTIKTYDLPINSAGKEKTKVHVAVPKGWEDPKGYYGMPLMLIADDEEGFKPSLSITPTDLKVEFDEAAMKKNQSEYKEGREAFMTKMGGKAISYEPYRTEKWDGIENAQVIGYKFALADKEYAERTYYVHCKGKLYHLKTIMLTNQENEFGPILSDTVKSFGCGEAK